MMKYKIKVNFHDKYTDKPYKVGDIVEFDEKRAKEIIETSPDYIELVEEKKTKK